MRVLCSSGRSTHRLVLPITEDAGDSVYGDPIDLVLPVTLFSSVALWLLEVNDLSMYPSRGDHSDMGECSTLSLGRCFRLVPFIRALCDMAGLGATDADVENDAWGTMTGTSTSISGASRAPPSR